MSQAEPASRSHSEPDAPSFEPQPEARPKTKRRRGFRWWRKELIGWLITMVVVLVVITVMSSFRAPDIVGQTPSFALQDLDGKTVRLEDFRGKPVLLNVWATWCPPCKFELPALARFARNHPDIQVLGLATASPPDDLRRMSADLPYPNLVLDDQTGLDLQVEALPTTFFLDENGKVVRGHSGILFYPQLWWLTR